MKRHRAQAIIIQNMKVLFGAGKIRENYFRHFFIGGGVQDNETPEEAIIREIREEANVEGRIVFKLNDLNASNHHTYLVDIGEQIPSLGYDPEEKNRDFYDKTLQKIELISLFDAEKFTKIDITYFKLLINECMQRKFYPEWYKQLEVLINKYEI